MRPASWSRRRVLTSASAPAPDETVRWRRRGAVFPGGVGVLGNAMRRPRGRLRLPAGVKAPAPPLPSQETRLIIISAPFRSNAPIHRSICSGSQWWEPGRDPPRGLEEDRLLVCCFLCGGGACGGFPALPVRRRLHAPARPGLFLDPSHPCSPWPSADPSSGCGSHECTVGL